MDESADRCSQCGIPCQNPMPTFIGDEPWVPTRREDLCDVCLSMLMALDRPYWFALQRLEERHRRQMFNEYDD